MYGFEFKNNNNVVYYSKELNIYVGKRPSIMKAQRIINYIEVPGKNGSLTEDMEVYKDIKLVFQCTMKDKNLEEKSLLLNNWLDGSGILRLDYLTNFFFKVKEVKLEEIDINYITGDFTVTFICDPFKHYQDGLNITELNRPNTLYAPEFAVKSYPVIKIYGNGNGALIINNTTIELKNINEYVILDSNMQECYKDINLNKKMIGEFPILQEENKISWTGGIDKIEIIPNWCCL